jgi:hypothetical protein
MPSFSGFPYYAHFTMSLSSTNVRNTRATINIGGTSNVSSVSNFPGPVASAEAPDGISINIFPKGKPSFTDSFTEFKKRALNVS